MDHFGIGQAMRGMALTYFQTSRQSGRTTSLVESLKDGDRVWCVDRHQAEHLQRKCRERGLAAVECLVADPAGPLDAVFRRGPATGRTLFDHGWVEQFYFAVLERAAQDIDRLQRETSGPGTAHIETRRRAQEMARWRS